MRVVLVHPAGSNWVPGKRDITAAANRMAPIGLLSIAACLEARGHEVRVHDCLGPGARPGVAPNVKAILDGQPELVGFSTTTAGFLDACGIAEALKAARPGLPIIFGGVHVSGVGATLLERFDQIDLLAIGEGEATMLEVAEGRAPAEIDGLAWRDGDRIAVNRPRAKIPELDTLPFPAYGKLRGFPGGYRLPPFSYIESPGTAISTSRGCIYRCSYCDRSVFKQGFRSNSAEYTYAHLQHLRSRFGIRHVNIYDDLFTVDRPRVLALCEKLAKEPLGMRFNCAVRVGHTDDALLEALKDAGCLMVSIGVESGDPDLLEQLKAGVTLDQVEETVRRVQAKGLRAKGLFMMGVAGDTEASIERTSDFVLRLGLDDMNMSKFTPFPGASCFATIREHGSFEEDWRQMNCLNFVFVPNGIASRERLDQLYNRHVKRFYTDPAWRKKLWSRLWEHRGTLAHMARNWPSFLAARRHFEP